SKAILQFFLERYTPGLFLHFEMIPDRLPERLRALIRQFPAGALQFDVAGLISRRQDNAKLEENLRFLRAEAGVHVHADLIVGLPGEDLESFGRGFDRLVALRPQEIQVGILKRLRVAPYWDVVANSGNFVEMTQMLCGTAARGCDSVLPSATQPGAAVPQAAGE